MRVIDPSTTTVPAIIPSIDNKPSKLRAATNEDTNLNASKDDRAGPPSSPHESRIWGVARTQRLLLLNWDMDIYWHQYTDPQSPVLNFAIWRSISPIPLLENDVACD